MNLFYLIIASPIRTPRTDLSVSFSAKLLDRFLIKHIAFTTGSVFNILLDFKP